MPRVSPIQTNFNGGEMSPLVLGRTAEPRYKESLKLCLNYIPLIQGPITRRPGTAFSFPAKFPGAVARLIPFTFSTTQAYMLEFGNTYIRFFKNNAILAKAGFTITSITQASPGILTATGHTYVGGEHIVITGVVGMTELNNREFVVAGVSGSTFTLLDNITGSAVNTSGFHAYTSGGSVAQIYEVTSPYLTADLPALKYTQSNDVLYLVHPKYAPRLAVRASDTSWTLNDASTGTTPTTTLLNGPYFDENNLHGRTITLTSAVIGGGTQTNLQASGVDDINGGLGFLGTDVGRMVRFKYSATWTYFRINSIVNNGNVIVDVLDTSITVPNNTATLHWQMGFWSSTNGWPSAVVFYQDRLVFGGAGGDPTRFDGSNTSDFLNFAPSAPDGTIGSSNAYSFSLSSNDVNSIVWLTSDEQGLLIGTTGAEWVVTSSSTSSALSPTSVNAKKTNSYGSNTVAAVQLGKCTLFMQNGGKQVRELQYDFYTAGFVANDLTQISEHITNTQIVAMAPQKTPQPIVWCLRTDGVLAAMTYERELSALKVGWSRHIIGGAVSGGGQAIVESVAVLPSADGKSQDVWLIVQRYINGHTVRHVEYITQLFDDFTDIKNAFFVDAGLTYNGSSTSTISGLNHLEGQSVSVLGDGAAQSNKTVTGGRITLDTAASVVQVGLAYNSDGQKLTTDAGAADGTAMGKTRRTHRVAFNLLNTLGFLLGPDFSTLDQITLDDEDSGSFDEANALYTGTTSQIISCDYDFDNNFCWRQNQPLPGTILGIYTQLVTQDRS